jgi:hypothetical protein
MKDRELHNLSERKEMALELNELIYDYDEYIQRALFNIGIQELIGNTNHKKDAVNALILDTSIKSMHNLTAEAEKLVESLIPIYATKSNT